MSMTGKAIDRLLREAQKPQPLSVGGVDVLALPSGGGFILDESLPRKAPPPQPLVVHTLGGLCDYLDANRDQLTLSQIAIHIVDHAHVEVRSPLQAPCAQRFTYARAEALPVLGDGFRFGEFLDAERFIIGVQALFVADDERARLLGLIGGIKESAVRDTLDDGVAQEVTARAGVALVTRIKVPNPITLAPFRTFREVEQPASPFVLRLKSGREGERPQAALFEADGGKWKLVAIDLIRVFLRARLPDALAIFA